MIVTVDKEDFVVAVKREPSEAQTEAAIAEIHREDMSPMNMQTQICKGPWHRKGGVGTVLPVSAFRVSKRNGSLLKTCIECLDSKHGVLPMGDFRSIDQQQDKRDSTLLGMNIPEPMSQMNPKWRITIIRKTTIDVHAADFLDAAAQAGDGEVVKVERLD